MPHRTNVLGLFWKAQGSVQGRFQKKLSFWVMKTLNIFKAFLENNDAEICFEEICKKSDRKTENNSDIV